MRHDHGLSTRYSRTITSSCGASFFNVSIVSLYSSVNQSCIYSHHDMDTHPKVILHFLAFRTNHEIRRLCNCRQANICALHAILVVPPANGSVYELTTSLLRRPGETRLHDGIHDARERTSHAASQTGIAVARVDSVHCHWRDGLQSVLQRPCKEHAQD